MRNNLIIKNIPEEDQETWDISKNKVGEILESISGVDRNKITEGIERAHRGGKKKADKRRNIYIRFYSWDDAEYYFQKFKSLAMKKHHFNYKIDRQYSKKLTSRRNEAMLERKRLLDSKQIVSGYVDFPAKLLVKKSVNTRYALHAEY